MRRVLQMVRRMDCATCRINRSESNCATCRTHGISSNCATRLTNREAISLDASRAEGQGISSKAANR